MGFCLCAILCPDFRVEEARTHEWTQPSLLTFPWNSFYTVYNSTSCNRLSHQWWSHSSFSSALGFLGGILLFTASSSFVILCTPPRWTMNGDQRSFFPAYNGVKLKREREMLSKLCKQWKGNALLYCSICILWSIMQPNCPSSWGAHLCFLLYCFYVDEPNYYEIETPCCGIEIRW